MTGDFNSFFSCGRFRISILVSNLITTIKEEWSVLCVSCVCVYG
jgi:hypothetical protein